MSALAISSQLEKKIKTRLYYLTPKDNVNGLSPLIPTWRSQKPCHFGVEDISPTQMNPFVFTTPKLGGVLSFSWFYAAFLNFQTE